MKLLIKVFLLSITLIQSAQAGRYYNSDYGRFVSRDTIGYHDGMSLYNAYFAERLALDPSGTVFIPIESKQKLETITSMHPGTYGVTYEILNPPLVGADEFEVYNEEPGCCVELIKSAEFHLVALSLVPIDNLVGGQIAITERAVSEVAKHEARRREYLRKGHDAYLDEGYKGFVCADSKEEAKNILKEWLDKQRGISLNEFKNYVIQERAKVSAEVWQYGPPVPITITLNNNPENLSPIIINGGSLGANDVPDYYTNIKPTSNPPQTQAQHNYNQ